MDIIQRGRYHMTWYYDSKETGVDMILDSMIFCIKHGGNRTDYDKITVVCSLNECTYVYDKYLQRRHAEICVHQDRYYNRYHRRKINESTDSARRHVAHVTARETTVKLHKGSFLFLFLLLLYSDISDILCSMCMIYDKKK